MNRHLIIIMAGVLAAAGPVAQIHTDTIAADHIQAETLPPTASKGTPQLSDVQRLQLQTIAQRIEIAQLKAQAAQRDFEGARADLAKLVTSLRVQGYELDLQTLSYVPQKVAAPK